VVKHSSHRITSEQAHRNQAKLPPLLPTSARDYTRVSFAALTTIAILAYEGASEEPDSSQPFSSALLDFHPPLRPLDFTPTPLYQRSAVAHLTLDITLAHTTASTLYTTNTIIAVATAVNTPTWTCIRKGKTNKERAGRKHVQRTCQTCYKRNCATTPDQ
jgi:hypothetical protein